MMTPDGLEALRLYLAAQSELSDAVSERIYALDLPIKKGKLADTDLAMPQKCILVRPAGGPDERPIETLRVDCFCYGQTMPQAEGVRRKLHAALRALHRHEQSGVLLHSAALSAGPNIFRDRDTDWPAVFETWMVRFGAEDA